MTADSDLFHKETALTPDERKKLFGTRSSPKPAGHAALPGSGPAGESCRTCQHIVRRRMAGTYLKCGLMRRFWTGGGATDIRARDPACRRWEKIDKKEADDGL